MGLKGDQDDNKILLNYQSCFPTASADGLIRIHPP